MTQVAVSALILFMLTATSAAVLGEELPTQAFQTQIVAEELDSPWSMAHLGEDEWVITERAGTVVFVDKQSQHRVTVELPELYHAGQGGLLDILPAPDYPQSQHLYLSYAQGSGASNRLAVVRATKVGKQLEQLKPIFTVNVDKATPVHYAGRLLFLPDGTLLISSGDGFDYREQAQVLNNQMGKILRINADGTLPQDNPFTLPSGDKSAVYSLGHRNPQGLIFVPETQIIYSHEHGPKGGDELNIIEAGNNYGWPVVTQGNDYSGARISPFRNYPGMIDPVVDWTPSIAPSGMAYYPTTGANSSIAFASLKGHALITTLVDRQLYAVNLLSGAYQVMPLFTSIRGRLRDVLVTATGEVAVLSDGDDGKLYLLSPAS